MKDKTYPSGFSTPALLQNKKNSQTMNPSQTSVILKGNVLPQYL
jgi:hypothetical protein